VGGGWRKGSVGGDRGKDGGSPVLGSSQSREQDETNLCILGLFFPSGSLARPLVPSPESLAENSLLHNPEQDGVGGEWKGNRNQSGEVESRSG
jgi:hypothetical protein